MNTNNNFNSQINPPHPIRFADTHCILAVLSVSYLSYSQLAERLWPWRCIYTSNLNPTDLWSSPRKRGGKRKVLQRTARRCDAQGYMTILFTSSVLRSYWLANLVAVLVYSLPLWKCRRGGHILSRKSQAGVTGKKEASFT